MKLHLKISQSGLSHKLLTSSGEEIEGVVETALPTLKTNGDFAEIVIKLQMSSVNLSIEPDE